MADALVQIRAEKTRIKVLSFTAALACFVQSFMSLIQFAPISVAARSEARNVFVSSNTGIVVSNPTQGMNVCLRLLCVCIVLCEVAALRRADPLSKESYRLIKIKRLSETKRVPYAPSGSNTNR
jgi:hypothetical protein